jgi:cytochrome bd-type quinol oxidase subunit 2
MVVPMFHLTPAYPVWLTRALPAGLLVALCAYTLQLVPGAEWIERWTPWAAAGGVLVAASYAATTLWLQAKRRRRQADTTFVLWRAAMLSLLALALSSLAFLALPEWGASARAPVWLGVLAMPGLFMSVIAGMLYKIMPFLNWLHLQQQGGTVPSMPNMKQMIPEAAMRGQMRLHFAALALLLAAVPFDFLAVPAGLALIASSLRLLWNLLGATRVYLLCSAHLRARLSSPMPQPRRA